MKENRLLQLLRDNLEHKRPRMEVETQGDEATLYVYSPIGGWFGLPAADFVKELNGITAPTIRLRINSPGGDVFEARAMATAIRDHKSNVIAHVDGVAASAATLLCVASKEVEMADGAFFMIHQAWALAMGNCDDMLAMAGLLEKADASIAADYMKKTGKPKQQIVDWMGAETWFTAQEAKDAGFVDRVGSVDSNNADAQARAWNLSAYAKTPKALKEEAKGPSPYDRAALERRLSLFEKANQIAA